MSPYAERRKEFLTEFRIGTEDVGCWLYSGQFFIAILSVSSVSV